MFIRKHLKTCDSTNDVALAWVQAGAPHKSLVTCKKQTQGRGRQGRTWLQDAGSLAFSIILRPQVPLAEASKITLLTAIALSKTLQLLDLKTLIKWPNDLLLLDHRKCAGILTEAHSTGNQLDAVIIGIGINVVRSRNSPAEYGYLSDEGYLGNKTDFFDLVLPALESYLDPFDFKAGFKYLKKHSATLGKPIFGGLAVDINPDGSLLIQDPQGNLNSIYNY